MAHVIITPELVTRHVSTGREIVEILDDKGGAIDRIQAYGQLREPGCYDLGPDWPTREETERLIRECPRWHTTEEVMAMLAELKREYAT